MAGEKVGEILDIAVSLDIINKSGAWFSYGETRLGQGRDNVKELFLSNPELADEIEAKVVAAMKGFFINDPDSFGKGNGCKCCAGDKSPLCNSGYGATLIECRNNKLGSGKYLVVAADVEAAVVLRIEP